MRSVMRAHKSVLSFPDVPLQCHQAAAHRCGFGGLGVAQLLRAPVAARGVATSAPPRAAAAAGAGGSGDVGGQRQKVCIVQGASRGLGLEFVKQLLERPGYRVVAGCRDPAGSSGLQQLLRQHPGRLQVLAVDVTDEASIQAAADHVAASVSPHVDVCISTVGVLHVPGVMAPETSYSRVTPGNLSTCMETNAIGPFLVAKAFMPLLAKAEKENGATSDAPAVLACLSARVGSISDNGLGGWYSYRASKAALNMLLKSLAIEAGRKGHRVATLALHPGTCDTDLSKPFQKNVAPEKLFTRERAVRQLLAIVDGATMASNGRFYAWDGEEIPW